MRWYLGFLLATSPITGLVIVGLLVNGLLPTLATFGAMAVTVFIVCAGLALMEASEKPCELTISATDTSIVTTGLMVVQQSPDNSSPGLESVTNPG